MDSLLAEIERKRKQLDDNKVTSKKKYFKRGELAAQQNKDYHKKQEEKLRSKGLLSDKHEDDATNSFSDLIKPKIDKADQKYKDVAPSELHRRLREKGEPIKMFGESHEEGCQRLRLIEMMARDEDKGLRNDFKAAMDRLDQAYIDQLAGENNGDKSKAHDVKLASDITSLEDIKKMAEKFDTGDMSIDSKVVLEFLRHVSYLWGTDLNEREMDQKITVQGRLKSAQYEQTMSYLKPLFRKLRSVSLSKDILHALTTIVDHLMEREYVKANDKYLQMAIGNAPWPIGVTNPGIHARTGREKISTALVAHVLNDETQRKYIQGLKRLMTYCQKRFPADPSKCVEYKGSDALV